MSFTNYRDKVYKVFLVKDKSKRHLSDIEKNILHDGLWFPLIWEQLQNSGPLRASICKLVRIFCWTRQITITALLFNDMEMRGPVFCSYAKITPASYKNILEISIDVFFPSMYHIVSWVRIVTRYVYLTTHKFKLGLLVTKRIRYTLKIASTFSTFL